LKKNWWQGPLLITACICGLGGQILYQVLHEDPDHPIDVPSITALAAHPADFKDKYIRIPGYLEQFSRGGKVLTQEGLGVYLPEWGIHETYIKPVWENASSYTLNEDPPGYLYWGGGPGGPGVRLGNWPAKYNSAKALDIEVVPLERDCIRGYLGKRTVVGVLRHLRANHWVLVVDIHSRQWPPPE